MMGVFPYSPEPGTPMGRMDGQLPDEVKQQRVEELMLAQQEVAFAKAKSMVGQTIEVLIDRPAGRDEEDGYVARSQSQAPDIDSVTFVSGRIFTRANSYGESHRLPGLRPRRRGPHVESPTTARAVREMKSAAATAPLEGEA